VLQSVFPHETSLSVAVRCSVLHCFTVRCSVLQCVAVCCSVLYCVARSLRVQSHIRCLNVLQCVAVCCRVLHGRVSPRMFFSHHKSQCVAVCCSVWQCVVVQCNILQGRLECNPTLFVSLRCSVMQCFAVCCSVLHDRLKCNPILHVCKLMSSQQSLLPCILIPLLHKRMCLFAKHMRTHACMRTCVCSTYIHNTWIWQITDISYCPYPCIHKRRSHAHTHTRVHVDINQI